MSIKALALDLYKAQQNVAKLQEIFDQVSFSEQEAMAQKLREAQREMQLLRKMLDGEKESGAFRMRFSGFGAKK